MPMNKMNLLLDKIERRLGTKPMNLPPELQKDKWAEIIDKDTLDTFSRYYPNAYQITLDLTKKKVSEGTYVLDEYIPDGIQILGVKDIDWITYNRSAVGASYGLMDFMTDNYGLEDIMLLQARTDLTSMFNAQVFVEFVPPNRVRISTLTGVDATNYLQRLPITVFIKHAPNLMTIPPTFMETFEQLAIADVASFLYQNLKYYEGLETVYASIDMKLSDLQDAASKRDEIKQTLEESYVSASNKYQPIMLTI